MNMAAEISSIMERLQQQPQLRKVPERMPPCWALLEFEVCENGWHAAKASARPCPAELTRRRAAELGEVVDRFLPPSVDWRDGKPISPRLISALRKVNVWAVDRGQKLELREILERVRAFCAATIGHGLWTGDSGLGKSHFQAIAYFSALEQSVRAEWVDDPKLRRIITQRRSYEAHERAAGEDSWNRLLRAQLICYNDLASDRAAKFDQPGRPLLGSALWELLELGKARILAAANDGLERLADHPDVGSRVISRLAGSARGVPALVLHFEGEDQRLAHRAVKP